MAVKLLPSQNFRMVKSLSRETPLGNRLEIRSQSSRLPFSSQRQAKDIYFSSSSPVTIYLVHTNMSSTSWRCLCGSLPTSLVCLRCCLRGIIRWYKATCMTSRESEGSASEGFDPSIISSMIYTTHLQHHASHLQLFRPCETASPLQHTPGDIGHSRQAPTASFAVKLPARRAR